MSVRDNMRAFRALFVSAFFVHDLKREKAHGHNKPIGTQTALFQGGKKHGARIAGEPAETRGLHARLYNDAEKAKLGHEKGGSCPSDQWL